MLLQLVSVSWLSPGPSRRHLVGNPQITELKLGSRDNLEIICGDETYFAQCRLCGSTRLRRCRCDMRQRQVLQFSWC